MNVAATNGVTGLFCSSSLSRIVAYYAMSITVPIPHRFSAVLRSGLRLKEEMHSLVRAHLPCYCLFRNLQLCRASLLARCGGYWL
jgi:hypothetical protein